MDELLKTPNAGVDSFMDTLKKAMNGIRTYCVILSAIDLGVFEALKVPKGIDELSEELGCDRNLLLIMCRILCKLGLLSERNGVFENTKTSRELLTRDSFYSQIFSIKNTRNTVDLWMNLTRILREGAINRNPGEFFSEVAIHTMAQHSLLGELQRTVRELSKFDEFQKARRLLDLGGGHGLYAIAFTIVNPELEAYVFDLPQVVEVTKKYISRFGAKRVRIIPGNFFKDDIGKNYDVIFSSYNPGGKNPHLIPKIYSGLNRGGIYVNKQIFRDDREISLIDLEWNLWKFEGIEKSDRAYTFRRDLGFKDYISKLKEFGFRILEVIEFDEEIGSRMIVAKKV